MRDVMNYSYCPRIVYFENVLHEPQETTAKEYSGREKDKTYSSTSKRLKIVRYTKTELPPLERKYKVWLHSAKRNFQTVLDCLFYNEQENIAFPVQFKNTFTPGSVYRTQKLQLYGEASLAQELLGFRVPAGYIKFLKSNESIKLPINQSDLDWFDRVLGEIEGLIAGERLPEPTQYEKRCVDCCFKKQCQRA
ncbi:CRISPR-associated protein Cas4 [Candidatus Micrarchaeota archaeon CG_4_10_14_0_2_um_filter_55_9]|nr:MAG: CRISPR-associated protein Cas4 [Candidatus Micrarchaeota archaeon CG_4_10_14_0_2_um_filter_55_9]QBM01488.1 CRISPR-associated exonuclease Cas4 [uncultured archaeon]